MTNASAARYRMLHICYSAHWLETAEAVAGMSARKIASGAGR